jgi:predicted DNA-binding transcriptional regulator AlpA
MSKRERNWLPYSFSMEDIEYHFRVSDSKVYQWIARGLWPPPMEDNGIVRWVREECEDAFNRLPRRESMNIARHNGEARLPPSKDDASRWSVQRAA